MLIEIPYHDSQGSICPYCGTMFNQIEKVNDGDILFNQTTVRTYKCQCLNDHLVFVKTVSTITEDDYIFNTIAYGFCQDWEEHIDMLIPEGADAIPLIAEEDEAWVLHKKTSSKEPIQAQTAQHLVMETLIHARKLKTTLGVCSKMRKNWASDYLKSRHKLRKK